MTAANTHVAIVGGGLMGCWTAFFLRRRNIAATVIEKGVVGAQASGVNYGNLRIQGRHPEQFPLSLRAHSLWERFGELIGEDIEITRCGHLYVAHDEDHLQRLGKYADQAAAHGHEIERLGPNDLARRWPWLSRDVLGANFSARDGSANPRLSTPAIARAAAASGAEIIENEKVTSINADGPGFTLSTDRGRTLKCDHLVNAAGAWANDIAAMFNETAPMFAAGPPQFVTEPLPLFMQPSVQSVDGRVIARQVQRGNIIMAGYPRGPSDTVLNRAPVPPLKTLAGMRALGDLVPMLEHANVIRVWSGIEGYVSDMLPVIGHSETVDNLYHAFGFCGHGFQLSPAVGLCLSELIADGATETPLGAHRISRFAEPGWQGSAAHQSEFDTPLSANQDTTH